MDNEIKRYTVIIFTENQTGLLTQISNIFTRRNLDIWSLSAIPTEIPGIHSITIQTDGIEKKLREASLQIQNRVDVVRSYYFVSDQIINREIIMYRMALEEVKNFLAERTELKAQVLATPEED